MIYREGDSSEYSDELLDDLEKALTYFVYRTNEIVGHKMGDDQFVELVFILVDRGEGLCIIESKAIVRQIKSE